MGKVKYWGIAMTVLFIISIVGCTSHIDSVMQPNSPDESIQNELPDEGGTLKLSVTRFDTLNPIFNSNKSLFQLHQLIYESLIAFGEDMDVNPLLAEKWTISEDGQSIDFTLRDDVKWHDGEPFTVEDVIFTIHLIKGNIKNVQNTSIYKMSLQQISDVRKIEENVIRVTFTRPFSNGLEIMTFPILPKHLFEGNSVYNLNSNDFPVVGTGPYKLHTYEKMRKFVLERNEDYWGEKPYIDEIDVVIVPDQNAQISLFDNGDVDIAQPVTIDWGKYVDDKSINVYEFSTQNYEFIGFNFQNRLLQNQDIRRAIAHSIDRDKLIQNIYLGRGTPADTPIPAKSWLYNQEVLKYEYNHKTAKTLLEQNGYLKETDQNVRVNEQGDVLIFNLITNKENLFREKTAYFIKEELGTVGIELNIELLEWDEFNRRINERKFDMVLGGWELSYIPDLSFAFHSSQIRGTNFISYRNEKMDQLLESAFMAKNREEKKVKFKELQVYIVDELPYISLFFQNSSIIVRDKVKGKIQPRSNNIYFGIDGWYMNTKTNDGEEETNQN